MMGWLSSATGVACGGRVPQGWVGIIRGRSASPPCVLHYVLCDLDKYTPL